MAQRVIKREKAMRPSKSLSLTASLFLRSFLLFFPRSKMHHRTRMSTRKSAVADGVSTERKANVSNYQPLRNILWGIQILGIGESGND